MLRRIIAFIATQVLIITTVKQLILRYCNAFKSFNTVMLYITLEIFFDNIIINTIFSLFLLLEILFKFLCALLIKLRRPVFLFRER